jgi:glycosyltransferase involved in cell wall biosynthesis
LARLPADAEAEVRIAGDGPEREELAALATRLGLGDRVRWLGELSSSDVARELTRAQAFVLASRYEGLTNAGLEAMERGVPVILTRCGGLDQYVNERIGWVVPPEDVEALASVLLQAFSMDAQELARMGDQARKLVESNFDIRIIASRYIDLFQRCVAAPR